MGQDLVALVNIKIVGKWVFTPLTLIIIGFETHPYFLIMTFYQAILYPIISSYSGKT